MLVEIKKAIEKMRSVRDDFDFIVSCHSCGKGVFVAADIDVVAVLFSLCDIPKSEALFCVPSFTGKDVENISGVLVTQLLDLRSRFVFNQLSVERTKLDFRLEF